ncbi:hypothetical protein TRAPUB_9910 [Trametes pubescens]|uniref:Uncharacterized protein n=1 Tax=Trametes pubescens TaxID=154538 RepID=A0A1M2W183_TRAPU|nr:hypothetical protein TRAPUB_9910 [Trametes pubescens]
MKRSLLSLSPLISSTNLCYRTSLLARLKPRLCLSARPSSFSTLFLARALHDFRTPPSTLREQSILQFLSSRLAQATHRSVIRGGRAGGSYGGGPQGPWQRLRARINAIPSNYIFWGIIGLNGLVFASWNLAWMKYGSTLEVRHLSFDCVVLAFMLTAPLIGIGGITSSFAGIAWRNYQSPRAGPASSHGASGAIYSVISFFACVAPTATFALFGIIPLPAWAFVTGIFLYDGYSAVNAKVSTACL